MRVIQQKELRNRVGEVLRDVENGETVTVTVAGRPVAQLQPAGRRRWVSGRALEAVWSGPAPRGVDHDLEQLPGEASDPFVP